MRSFALGVSVLMLCCSSNVTLSQTANSADRFARLAEEAKALQGAEYQSVRNQLVKLANDNPSVFRQVCLSSNDWGTRLLCDIVAERVDKAAAIQKLLSLSVESPRDKRPSHRISYYGRQLIDNAKNTPFFLVECIWKQNEIRLSSIEEENVGAAVYALGKLGIKEARPVLEQLLSTNDEFVAVLAANALGTLAQEESVPALLKFVTSGYEQGAPSRSHVAAADALSRCLTPAFLDELVSVRDKTANGDFKSLLDLLIMNLKQKGHP